MVTTDVLIVGAGPTGLALALALTRLGVRVRIVDKLAAPAATSRALGVQARTLELYRQLGLADAVLAAGHRVPALNLWANGAHRARLPFQRALRALTAYPFLLIYPQDQHERLLIERLGQMGVTVERDTELLEFCQHGAGAGSAGHTHADGADGAAGREEGHILARLAHAGAAPHVCAARYIAGCDGAHSAVRTTVGKGFPGGTYSRIFYVADIVAGGPAINGEIHLNLDAASEFLAVFPLAAPGRARLIGTLLDERAERLASLTFADVGAAAVARLRIEVVAVNWFSAYRVHHRVAPCFRVGRAFLLGDAGHVHSPAGGQGMNTGIGDAVNLAWKLAAVLDGRAGDALLDTYEDERLGFARRLVATTDRVFTFATAGGWLAQLLRTRVAPRLLPLLNRVPFINRSNFRVVSQLAIAYRGSRLSQGRAGRVRGGDRLPWVAGDGQDNFACLQSMAWQVHVYGCAGAGLAAWCAAHGVALQCFAWRPEHRRAGLARDAVYLIRPDSYVALADPAALPAKLARYFTDHGIALPGAIRTKNI